MPAVNHLTEIIIAEAIRIHLLTYLRLSGLQVGLLINFGMDQLRHGISRVVNNYDGEKVTPNGR